MICFFDTETTGLTNSKLADSDPLQPRLVQIACILTEDNGEVIRTLSTIIKPEGFTIPTQASDVHGITTEKALKYGVEINDVIGIIYDSFYKAKLHVAHNWAFDKIILNGEFDRAKLSQLVSTVSSFCTMKASTDICMIPGHYGKYKWPKLAEAYEMLCGRKLEGAHNALNDVLATKELYFKLKELGL